LNYTDLSESELDEKLYEFRRQFRFQKSEKVLNEALACIVEVTFRVLGIRPYSVQIMGVLSQQKNFKRLNWITKHQT